jgi:glycyl-tRNA synthetase
MSDTKTKSMDDIVAIWQSSEIYGGINGFWDYGPLGSQLKRNLKSAWIRDIITCPPDGPDGHPIDMVDVDCTIVMHPKVWVASGHATGFNDPMVDCRACKSRFRADHLVRLRLWFENRDGSSSQVFSLFGVGEEDEVIEANRKRSSKWRGSAQWALRNERPSCVPHVIKKAS